MTFLSFWICRSVSWLSQFTPRIANGLLASFVGKLALLRIHPDAIRAPVSEEIEYHDFAAVIAQLERLAVDVAAFDVGCLFADAQTPAP